MHLDINNNPLTKRAERRYASFTEKQRRQIEILNDMTWKEYQLNVIKKQRLYLEKGMYFWFRHKVNVFFGAWLFRNRFTIWKTKIFGLYSF